MVIDDIIEYVLSNANVTSEFYSVMLLIGPALWMMNFYLIVRLIVGDSWSRPHIFMVSGVLMAIFWSNTPNIGQGWYWLTGLISYTLPASLVIVSLSILCKYDPHGMNRLEKTGLLLIFALLGLMVSGLHEIFGMLLGGVSILFIISVLYLGFKSRLLSALILLGFSAIGILINILAPGNEVRMIADGKMGGNIGRTIKWTFFHPELTILNYLNLSCIIFASLVILTTEKYRMFIWSKIIPQKDISKVIFVLMIFTFMSASSVIAISIWGTGLWPSDRIFNAAFAVFFIGWLFIITTISSSINLDVWQMEFMKNANIFSRCFLILSLLLAPNMQKTLANLPKSILFNNEVSARDDFIKDQILTGNRNVVLNKEIVAPGVYEWRDLGPNKEFWYNKCVARYFGAESIIGKAAPAKKYN